MEKYYIVTPKSMLSEQSETILIQEANSNFNCQGVESLSIEEESVDLILGERSYSGADIPEVVVDEVLSTFSESKSPLTKFYFNTKEDAERFSSLLKELGIEFNIELFDQEDWNSNWRKNFKAIPVGDNFIIVPEWENVDNYPNYRYKLPIYPGMGFGTGNHETTFLCIKLFLDLPLMRNSLDYGCGSGILGLAHKTVTPKAKVDFIDIDESALENCRQNIAINNFSTSDLRVFHTSAKDQLESKYQLVFANILKNTLLELKGEILEKVEKDGYLIVSGLLNEQVDELIKAYKVDSTLNHEQSISMGDWSAVLFKKL